MIRFISVHSKLLRKYFFQLLRYFNLLNNNIYVFIIGNDFNHYKWINQEGY